MVRTFFLLAVTLFLFDCAEEKPARDTKTVALEAHFPVQPVQASPQNTSELISLKSFKLDTVLGFNKVKLVLKPTDSVYIEEYVLKNHQLDSFSKIYSNWHNRALAIEEMVSKDKNFIKRTSEGLHLKLKNGKWKLVELKPDSDEGDHQFEYYFKDIGYYLVRVQCYEGNGYKLVDDSTGKQIDLFGRPWFSPDNKYVVSVNEDLIANYSRNGIQLFKIENRSLNLLGCYEPVSWGPHKVKWISENKFIMENFYLKDMQDWRQGSFYTEVTIKE